MNLSEQYEKEVIDSDKLYMVDGEINTNKYIDITVQRALSCLSKDDSQIGFFQYIILVNNLEGQCRSMGKLSDEYKEDLKKFTDSEEYKNTDEKNFKKDLKLANKKFELIMRELNISKKIEHPLIVKREDKLSD